MEMIFIDSMESIKSMLLSSLPLSPRYPIVVVFRERERERAGGERERFLISSLSLAHSLTTLDLYVLCHCWDVRHFSSCGSFVP